MRFITILLFLLLIAGQIYAQINPDRIDYIAQVEKYRKLKNTGTELTILGGVLTVVGAATIISYSDVSNTSMTNSVSLNIGFATLLAGSASLGTGIPLWIVGGVNGGRYKRKLHQLDVGFNANPKNTGLTFTYRF